MKSFLIVLAFVLSSCASNDETYTPYIHDHVPDAEVCEESICDMYPELRKCRNGYPAGNLECVFVEDLGCVWSGVNCVVPET